MDPQSREEVLMLNEEVPKKKEYTQPQHGENSDKKRQRRYCVYNVLIYGGILLFFAFVNFIFYEFHTESQPLANAIEVAESTSLTKPSTLTT